MRFFLSFIFCCLGQWVYSQKVNELQVNYVQYYDSDSPSKYPCILYIKNDVTVYRSIYNKRQYWDNGKSSPLLFTESTAKDNSDDYLKMNHTTKELLKHEHFPSEVVIVTDYYPEQQWTVTDETKQVSGYMCIKATTNYRGRDWLAWFTPDVPVPYGPWKFHGLPGLIMQAESVDGKYIIRAEGIQYQKDVITEIEFKKVKKVRNANPITYREFLKEFNEAVENINLKVSQQFNIKVITETPPRNGFELKYEWE